MVGTTRSLQSVAWCLLAAACQGQNSTAANGTPAAVAVIAGDVQLAEPHDTLPIPIRFRVTDSKGHPLPDVSVTLVVVLGDGRVPLSTLVTDDSGVVTTPWLMGTASGVQELQATAGGTASGAATARLCVAGECYPADRIDGPLSAITRLTLVTYDGSEQAVHPDVVSGHGALAGFWLVATPYPNGNVDVENPSVFHAPKGNIWTIPTGVKNPLALPDQNAAYLSDPDVVYNTQDQRLWLYYRGASNVSNLIYVMHSADGSHWDTPSQVLSVPAHQAVSPAIVHGAPQAPWIMWAVNAGPLGCAAANTTVERRTSTDGSHWSAASAVNLVQPGQAIWHIDVEWIPARQEYWAIYNTYPIGTSCSTHSLFVAQSRDGVTWTVGTSPIIRSGVNDDFQDIIYRATLMTDPKGNRMTLWLSGAKYIPAASVYVWHTATVSTTTANLLAIESTPASALSTVAVRPDLPYPEPDGPPR